MNRVLKRPMFRRGGSTDQGITSGLRTGYNRGRVVNPGGYAGDDFGEKISVLGGLRIIYLFHDFRTPPTHPSLVAPRGAWRISDEIFQFLAGKNILCTIVSEHQAIFLLLVICMSNI